MANTFSSIYVHAVFSTKRREPIIFNEIQADLWAYIGGILRGHDIIPIAVGGYYDHVHVLAKLKPVTSVSRMMQVVKGGSSWWIHQTYPHLRGFRWQDGYGAFSVSESAVSTVRRYISDQEEHHRRKPFREEYLSFLEEHGVEYDERFVWD